MLLFEPPAGRFGAGQLLRRESRGERLHDRGLHAITRPLLRSGLGTREQRFQAALAHEFEPLEKIGAGDPAQIGHLRGSVRAAGHQLHRQKPPLAPSVRLLRVALIDDRRHFRAAQLESSSGHSPSNHRHTDMSACFGKMVSLPGNARRPVRFQRGAVKSEF